MIHIKTADLCDDYESELEVCQTVFKSYGKNTAFFGPIATVRVFEDNILIIEALKAIPEGSVLVVDGGGSRNRAVMGGRLGEIARRRKLAGVIINGSVRDTEELAKLEVGIFALGSNPLKSLKEGKGESNIPVTFGGVDWHPGDYAYADQDGVVISKENLL